MTLASGSAAPERQVLFFSYLFPPLGGGGAFRSAKFVKYLPDHGFRPIVVSTRSLAYGTPDRGLAQDIPDTARVTRAPELPMWRMTQTAERLLEDRPGLGWVPSAIGWPHPSNGWVPSAAGAGVRLARRHSPDVIFSSAPPFTAHVAAWVAHRVTGLPWVADFRDEWARTEWEQQSARWRRVNTRVEDRLCRSASLLVTVLPELRIGSDRPASEQPKAAVIRNGVDLDDFPEPAPVIGARMTIAHIGSLYGPRVGVARRFAVALALAVEHGVPRAELEYRLIGRGPEVSVPNEVPSARTGHVPHREAIAAMQSSTVLVLCIPDEGIRPTMPAKVFDYLAARRPIICLAPSGNPAAELIESARAGTIVHPDDLDGMARVIADHHERWRAGALEAPLPPADTVLRPYGRRELTGRLAELLTSVIQGPSGEPPVRPPPPAHAG